MHVKAALQVAGTWRIAWIARSGRVAVPLAAAGLLIAGFNAVKDLAVHPGHTAALVLLVWRALQAWPTR